VLAGRLMLPPLLLPLMMMMMMLLASTAPSLRRRITHAGAMPRRALPASDNGDNDNDFKALLPAAR